MKKLLCYVILFVVVSFFQGCFWPSTQEGKLTLLSDKIGLSVEGPHGFYGTITKESITDSDWDFSGEFTFPNSLYFYLGFTHKVEESYPENIVIELYVKRSLLGELIAPSEKKVRIEKKINASNEAKFRVVFNTF
ncbi:MAG: hypothetical protein N3G21_11990 [Candidatus Hydrogenedentes bacterium]|nr:hypothetical protein [Candidatus Hydrogenedentota bacterium]